MSLLGDLPPSKLAAYQSAPSTLVQLHTAMSSGSKTHPVGLCQRWHAVPTRHATQSCLEPIADAHCGCVLVWTPPCWSSAGGTILYCLRHQICGRGSITFPVQSSNPAGVEAFTSAANNPST